MTPQAILFNGVGQPLEAVSQSIAPLKDAEIRVRILCCTLCRSDLSTYTGRRTEATPTVLGHEVVGTILEFGPEADVQNARIGDRITWAVVAHCGECFFCLHDLQQKCESGLKYGHHETNPLQPDGGGLADTITLVRGTSWFQVPDSISTPVASLANCAGATAAAILEAAGPIEGRRVIVFGSGLLGVIASAMLASKAAQVIVAIDPDPDCRARAITFGATEALDPYAHDFEQSLITIVGPHGADVALELAGHSETVEECLTQVRVGGTVVLAGTVSPVPAVSLDPQLFVRRMLTLRGVHNYQPRHLKQALDFFSTRSQKDPWESLIAESFSLERVEEAFAAAQRNPGRRIAVIPSGVLK